jgi:hypothetical protein
MLRVILTHSVDFALTLHTRSHMIQFLLVHSSLHCVSCDFGRPLTVSLEMPSV